MSWDFQGSLTVIPDKELTISHLMQILPDGFTHHPYTLLLAQIF